jgi:Gpi18-like mannosyltransferase
MIFKKHLFKIGCLFLLLSTGFLCVYSVWNYNGNTSPTQTRIEHVNTIPSEQNRPAVTPNQTPKGQFPNQNGKQHMAPPNGVTGGAWKGSPSADASTDYSSSLIVYAVIYLGLFVAAYYLFIYKKIKIEPGRAIFLILTLLCAGLLLRISSATLMAGHPFDINTFKSWATAAANNLLQVYSSTRSSDYPPLYMYVLFIIGKISSIPAMIPYYPLLLKLPAIMADIATSYLIYKLAKKYLSLEISILLSAFYIFNPAIFINSTFWGQVDSFFTLIVVLSVFMLSEKRIGLASALFTAAVLMKPQGIIFLPVLFFELLRQKNLKNFIKAAVSALGTAAIIVLPFSLNNGVLWIFELFSKTVGEYPYASVNAFNLFSLLGANFKNDASTWLLLSYHTWGMIFIVLITAYSWFIYIKGNSTAFIPAVALLQIAGVFTLSTSMHERYLFPAAALAILAFIYLRDKRLLLLAVGFSTTIYINTHVVLFATLQGVNSLSFSPTLIITSLLNVLLLGYLMKVLFDIAVKKKICNVLTEVGEAI